jgi:hypothetical protein
MGAEDFISLEECDENFSSYIWLPKISFEAHAWSAVGAQHDGRFTVFIKNGMRFVIRCNLIRASLGRKAL